jgi:hypothetical protein
MPAIEFTQRPKIRRTKAGGPGLGRWFLACRQPVCGQQPVTVSRTQNTRRGRTGLRSTSGAITMNAKDKAVFVHDLISSVHDTIKENIHKMPEDWDGHELRQYIADCFASQVARQLTGKRKREYTNTVIVANL